jgi:hypothetical protein
MQKTFFFSNLTKHLAFSMIRIIYYLPFVSEPSQQFFFRFNSQKKKNHQITVGFSNGFKVSTKNNILFIVLPKQRKREFT